VSRRWSSFDWNRIAFTIFGGVQRPHPNILIVRKRGDLRCPTRHLKSRSEDTLYAEPITTVTIGFASAVLGLINQAFHLLDQLAQRSDKHRAEILALRKKVEEIQSALEADRKDRLASEGVIACRLAIAEEEIEALMVRVQCVAELVEKESCERKKERVEDGAMLILFSACIIKTFDERMKPFKYAMYSQAAVLVVLIYLVLTHLTR
jgi:Trp operon repressor